MRKVIGGAFISLDGVVQAPCGPNEDNWRLLRTALDAAALRAN